MKNVFLETHFSYALKEIKMEKRMNCILIEDNVLEFLDETMQQMSKGLVCCKCPNPCDKTTTRCAVAMKNLLTDINMFVDSYKKHNKMDEQAQE